MKCIIYSPTPPKVDSEGLYSVHYVCRVLSAPGYKISSRSVYRWIQMGVLRRAAESKHKTRISGREILEFWRGVTTDIVFGNYPRWSKSECIEEPQKCSKSAVSV